MKKKAYDVRWREDKKVQFRATIIANSEIEARLKVECGDYCRSTADILERSIHSLEVNEITD